ncbi:uncharacterized protein N0V89_012241 [Didymosphaeria variabile]|uniref:Uncharacterized protein n=1 Tax=Didymosphaeria variabile TaxID=1932322 RepID=A0A9W8X8V6_9PLEO|nr:uncharacterized protein N0V89_012241 [Didymosphaeria variabile]KAJ4344498.1 hypothetical protein N0V89_012241 [Didymosphaeria variabile]
MSPGSLDSAFDMDKFQSRTQHIARDPSPDAQANGRAETDFAAVGAAFWYRRESEPRPRSLDLSEGEDIAQDPLQMTKRAELFSDADAVVAGNTVPSRSPATPTPTQPHRGSYIQLSDLAQVRKIRDRKGQTIRRRNQDTTIHGLSRCSVEYRLIANSLTELGPGSQSSIGTPDRRRRTSDTSNDDGAGDEAHGDDELDGRGRSATPMPYFPQSYTPSHHSQQTQEEHREGQGPLSPNPWSSNFLYNLDQQERTKALEGADAHFPVNKQPRAERAYREDARSAKEDSAS